MVAVGIGYLHIVAFTYVVYAVMFVSNGVINGAGYTYVTTLVTILTLLGLRIPLAWHLSRLTHSPTGIWYAMLISVGTGMVLSVGCYLSGIWRTPIVRTRAG